MSTWNASSIDSLEGKTFIVTGGTSGIGFAAVRELLRKGALVITGGHDEAKGRSIVKQLQEEVAGAKILFYPLDLGSFRSVFGFAEKILREHPVVDVLINNAGIAAVPSRMESQDGHELIFSVNYLGHFVLTSQLFGLLLRSRDPRVITVSSLKHHSGKLNFNDLDQHVGYSAERAYSQSKLALLMFALELHRRCRVEGIKLRSIPVHPGAVDTEIFDLGPKIAGQYFHPIPVLKRLLLKSFGQSPEKGCLPLLFAATSIEVRSGVYYGPDSLQELWGNPTEARVAVQAENMLSAARLWEESERMTGVRFDVGQARTIGLH